MKAEDTTKISYYLNTEICQFISDDLTINMHLQPESDFLSF